jgi:hypothetical protein
MSVTFKTYLSVTCISPQHHLHQYVMEVQMLAEMVPILVLGMLRVTLLVGLLEVMTLAEMVPPVSMSVMMLGVMLQRLRTLAEMVLVLVLWGCWRC